MKPKPLSESPNQSLTTTCKTPSEARAGCPGEPGGAQRATRQTQGKNLLSSHSRLQLRRAADPRCPQLLGVGSQGSQLYKYSMQGSVRVIEDQKELHS